MMQYFRDARDELSRVSWPTRSEVLEGTQAVLLFVIGLTVIVFAYDFIFAHLTKLVLP